jgi:hypothetical protein
MVSTETLGRELDTRGFVRLMRWSHGVDCDLFRPRAASIFEFPRPIFLTCARVAIEKNLDAFLSLDLPGSKVVVGDGSARKKLQTRFPGAHSSEKCATRGEWSFLTHKFALVPRAWNSMSKLIHGTLLEVEEPQPDAARSDGRPESTLSGHSRSRPRTAQLGGKHAYGSRLRKDRSPCRSRRSILSVEWALLPICDVPARGSRR